MIARQPRLLRAVIVLTGLGVLLTLIMLIRVTGLTLALFMFVAQPLLLVAVVLLAWRVVRDLRRSGLV
ncbi:MAG TPA: hypothetical protein VFR64_15360 [Methylomirabilota bacterium]|nr:hypothetical protein [Methylomirabilota bacterium]